MFQRQNPAAFSNTAIAGGYVFDFNGIDVNGSAVNPASYVGRFDADGAGSVGNGLFDSNIGGALSVSNSFPGERSISWTRMAMAQDSGAAPPTSPAGRLPFMSWMQPG